MAKKPSSPQGQNPGIEASVKPSLPQSVLARWPSGRWALGDDVAVEVGELQYGLMAALLDRREVAARAYRREWR